MLGTACIPPNPYGRFPEPKVVGSMKEQTLRKVTESLGGDFMNAIKVLYKEN